MPRILSNNVWKRSYFYFLVILSIKLGYIHSKQPINSCSYKFSPKIKNVTFTGKIQTASSGSFTALFNICDDLPSEYCGENVKLCIKRTHDDSFLLGDKYVPAYLNSNITLNTNSLYLSKLAASFCDEKQKDSQVILRFECEDDSTDEPKLIVIDECNFEIRLLHPTCIPKCTTRIHDHLVDLRSLMNVYHVYDDIGNFSIGLCELNAECETETSNSVSCLMTDNKTTPLSGDLDMLQYYEDNGVMKIHGKYKAQHKSLYTILEIQIKCEWAREEPLLYFLKRQSKTYYFEMLTSSACLKTYFPLQIKHGQFLYNFEPLNKKKVNWKIVLSHHEEILLNIFEPLAFLDERNNNCSRTNSQICLKNGSEYINLGSIHTPPKINDDIISVTFTSGTTCRKSNQQRFYEQYQTYINFVCGKDVGGPRLLKMENCTTHLLWQTPSACPKYDKSACKEMIISDQNCLLPFDNHVFNLTGLYKKNSKYVIEDEDTETEYLLNVCGPVVDDEVACNDKNLIYLRNRSESSLERRVVGLGKMKNMYYHNNQLILETSSGGLCNPHDYQSNIYFECSNEEEQPKLKNKTNCRYDFMWKTSAACPLIKELKIDSGCVFQDHSTSNIIDLTDLKREHYFLKMNMFGINYIFDLCNTYKEQCISKDGCVHAPAKKHLLTYDSKTYVEFPLNKPCNSSSDFNRTLMELECDPIQNNDHYTPPKIAGCVLRYKLSTHLACKNQESSLCLYDISETENNNNENKSNEISGKNCYVNNPLTHYSFDLRNLKLNFTAAKCPTYRFNYTKNLTELIYDTGLNCESHKSHDKIYRYSVLLKCSEEYFYNLQKRQCQEIHTYGLSEYCKLLAAPTIKNASMNWLTITGITISVIFGMVLIILLIFWSRKCINRRFYQSIPLSFPYNKDGDL